MLILTQELRYPQKRGVNRKQGRGGEFQKFFFLGEERITYHREGRVCLDSRVRGKLYRLTTKWTSFKTVDKDFPYTLRVPSTDCFESILLHKKCIFLNNQLFFGSLFSVVRYNSSVLFHLKLYMLWTKGPYQSANFQTCDCSHEIQSNSLRHCLSHELVFL